MNKTLGKRVWLGVGVTAAAAFTAAGAFGGSGSAATTSPAHGPSRADSPGVSTASGRCSKAEAIDAVKRLGLRDVSATYPVWKVLCGAFAGPGSQVMVASISGLENLGMLYWAVFRWSAGEWQFLMRQRQAAVLTAAGSDIRETVSIFQAGDSRCCPSGGTKARIWHWNGSRFAVSAWKQETPSAQGAAFRSPSGGIECGMGDDGQSTSGRRQSASIECWTFRPPLRATLYPSGGLVICRRARCTANIGEAPTLAYGRQITVGRFRCQSLQIGVRCTVIRSGKGFLINRDGVSRVGP
jgi:hypothetical protein